MTQKTKAIMSLGLVAGLGMAALPLSSYADSDYGDVTISAVVNETVSLTGCSSPINLALTTANIEETDPELATVSADCSVSANTNNASGANITLSMKEGDAHNGALYNATTGTSIMGGSPLTAANQWGFSIDSGATYAAVPTSGAAASISSSDSAGILDATVTFGVRGDSSLTTGTYTNDVTFTASTNL